LTEHLLFEEEMQIISTFPKWSTSPLGQASTLQREIASTLQITSTLTLLWSTSALAESSALGRRDADHLLCLEDLCSWPTSTLQKERDHIYFSTVYIASIASTLPLGDGISS
jgi:hypothetical protein